MLRSESVGDHTDGAAVLVNVVGSKQTVGDCATTNDEQLTERPYELPEGYAKHGVSPA